MRHFRFHLLFVSNVYFLNVFRKALILVLWVPGVQDALIAPSGCDEWMTVITGVGKHIKPAYEQAGQIPNRFHRGPVSVEANRIYLDFSVLICTGWIHRYNLLYARPLCRRVDHTCRINALVILVVRYKYPPRRYTIESLENSTDPIFLAALLSH